MPKPRDHHRAIEGPTTSPRPGAEPSGSTPGTPKGWLVWGQLVLLA